MFNLKDIRLLESDFHSNRLVEWQKKGYIKKLANGRYIFSDLGITDEILFLLGNKIYSPSYVSLQSAFQFYRIIPESVFKVTSITTKETRKFNTVKGEFLYSSVKKENYFGYGLIKYQDFEYKMAYLEKALIDFFYLFPQYSTIGDVKELRFNLENLRENLNMQRLDKYLEMIGSEALSARILNLVKLIDYD